MSTKRMKNGIEELSNKISQVLNTVDELSDDDSQAGDAYRDYLNKLSSLSKAVAQNADRIELNNLLKTSPVNDLVMKLSEGDLALRGTLTEVRQRCELSTSMALRSAA